MGPPFNANGGPTYYRRLIALKRKYADKTSRNRNARSVAGLLGGRRDGQRRVVERDHHRLGGVVQVGLARPDRVQQLVVAVELVEPRAVDVVDDVFVGVLQELGVALGVFGACRSRGPASRRC